MAQISGPKVVAAEGTLIFLWFPWPWTPPESYESCLRSFWNPNSSVTSKLYEINASQTDSSGDIAVSPSNSHRRTLFIAEIVPLNYQIVASDSSSFRTPPVFFVPRPGVAPQNHEVGRQAACITVRGDRPVFVLYLLQTK
jgi:hypothetical protein